MCAWLRICTVALFVLLGLASSSAASTQNWCAPFPLKTWPNEKYNREVGSNVYLLFALASLEAYGFGSIEEDKILFRVREYGKPNIWQKRSSIDAQTGMHADIYYNNNEDDLNVLIAFRGTRGFSVRDWYSNFSPVTRFLPFANAYDSAREMLPAVINQARIDAGGKKVRFIATGHSLGGGLAQHVAQTFPCFSAATFDTSCVVNTPKLDAPLTPMVVNLYETGDELTWACKLAGIKENENYRQFNVEVISGGFQHRILGFVVGMSRLVTHCQQDLIAKRRSSCAIPLTDRRAHDLYCSSYGYVGPDKLCEEKYWKKP